MIKEEEKETVIIEPFEGCNFQVEVPIPKNKKENKPRPFPHNMQTNNMQLLQKKYYHLFDGDAAIKVESEEHIEFNYKLFKDAQIEILKTKYPYNKMGKYLIIIGYDIMNCNPHFTEKQLFDCLYHIFVYYIQIPQLRNIIATSEKLGNICFTEKNRIRVEKAASQVYNKPFKGKIKKQPKTIFNPDYDLTGKERLIVSGELNGKKKVENRIKEIYNTLLNWNPKEGKPTQVKIAKKLGVHKNTVKNYWKESKQMLSTTI